MSRNIARKLEKRHEAIMKYTGGDMISFVLTCTELQKDMLAELERLQERVEQEINGVRRTHKARVEEQRQEKELSK